MTTKDGINLGHLAPQAEKPAIIDLGVREQALFDGITEMTVKFETPEARQAREKQDAQKTRHQHLTDYWRLALASIVLVVFLCLSVYLLAFKPHASEIEQLMTVVGVITGGAGMYLFRSKPNISD